MDRKRRMKDAISLKAQEDAHKKLADDPDVNVKEHTREYWKKEAIGYHRQLEGIIEKARFPDSYIKELEEEGKRKGEQLYQKRKRDLKIRNNEKHPRNRQHRLLCL